MAVIRSNERQDEFNEADYINFKIKLFSSITPPAELKSICRTLAHLPARPAQDLLDTFMKSARAHEVECLDFDTPVLTMPRDIPPDKKAQKQQLALEVLQEMQEEINELKEELAASRVTLAKKEIEYEALRDLVHKGEVDSKIELELLDKIANLETGNEGLRKKITLKEQILGQIKETF